MERINLNSNEKTAREIAGLENGKFFTMNNDVAEKLRTTEENLKHLDKIEEKKAKVESIGNILHEIFRTLLSSIRNVVPMPGSDHLTLILP